SARARRARATGGGRQSGAPQGWGTPPMTHDPASPEAEERFRALVAHSSDIITVLEPDGTWRSSSAAGTRLLGYEEGVDPDGGIFSLLPPDDVELAMQAFQGVLDGTRAGAPPVVRVRAAHGAQ